MKHFKKDTPLDFILKKAVKKPIPISCIQIHEPFTVDSLEGKVKGKAGDWLMVGIKGERYICSNEIFMATYDIIE